jgi:hypothetical protein
MTNPKTSELTAAQKTHASVRKRIQTRQDVLLRLLSDGHWHPNYECSETAGVSWHCYLYSLRKIGWIIQSRRVKGGVWEYMLLGRGRQTQAPAALSGPQQRVLTEVATAIRKIYGEQGVQQVAQRLSPWLADEVMRP